MSSAVTSIERYQRLPSEDAMQDAIEEMVRFRGGRVWHVNDSRTAPELVDLPDLIIVCGEWVALLELKSQTRPVTEGQREVAGMVRCAKRAIGGVVRPQPKAGEMAYDDVLRWLATI